MEKETNKVSTTAENTNKSQVPNNKLLTCKEFLNPKLIAEYCSQGFIEGSAAVRLYIAASIFAHIRQKKDYFEQAANIARKLNVTPELVRQAIQRQDKIVRGGFNGQRGRRHWIISGINDQLENNNTLNCG